MYADYEFYVTEYRGKLTEADYTPYAEKAGAYIDAKTDFLFKKNGLPSGDTSLARRLKICACTLADQMHKHDMGTGFIKSSEKVGNYSVSYAYGAVKTYDEQMHDIMMMYIPDVVQAVMWI